MVQDKIESVKNISEVSQKQAVEAAQEASNREHFQSLMNTTDPLNPNAFERVDQAANANEPEQKLEKNPIFGDENVSSQKGGSATDQENKKRQQADDDEVEEVSATGSKKKGTQSQTLMDEMGKVHSSSASPLEKSNVESIRTQAKETIGQIDQVKTQLTKAPEIKPSYQTLLQHRLAHIDDHLKIALSKVGVEQQSLPPVEKTEGKGPLNRFLDMLTSSQDQLDRFQTALGQIDPKQSLSPAELITIQMKMNYVQQQVELFTNLLNKALESTKTIMNVQV